MRYFACIILRSKTSFFIVLAILCSVCSHAQSDPSHTFLNIATVADDQESTEIQETQTPKYDSSRGTRTSSPHHIYKSLFLDIGTADLTYTTGTITQEAHGITWAFSGQLGCRIKTKNNYQRMFLSAGLEVRNFNSTYTLIDSRLGITNDNLQFWYAGVPLMFQYVNTKHHEGNNNDINCYFQLGVSLGYKAVMSFSRVDGNETIEDKSANYNNVLVQPFVSAGISYTTKRKVCLIGPFFAYSTNNLSTLANVTANFSSYGIRLSALMFR